MNIAKTTIYSYASIYILIFTLPTKKSPLLDSWLDRRIDLWRRINERYIPSWQRQKYIVLILNFEKTKDFETYVNLFPCFGIPETVLKICKSIFELPCICVCNLIHYIHSLREKLSIYEGQSISNASYFQENSNTIT